MLSELQGSTAQNIAQIAHQGRAAVPSIAPVTGMVPTADAGAVHLGSDIAPVKVQAPKPVEIKVDTEKMKAALQESLQKLSEAMRDGGRSLNFTMDEKVGGLVILVKNSDTGEIVRQIPSDVVVRIAHNLEAFKGLLHNELT